MHQPSASRPDGPDPPFVYIKAFIITDSSMSSYATGWIGLVVLCISISREGSLGSGYFYTSNSSVSLLSGRIPLCMLSVNTFRAPLTFPLLIRFLNFNEILAVVIPSLSDPKFC